MIGISIGEKSTYTNDYIKACMNIVRSAGMLDDVVYILHDESYVEYMGDKEYRYRLIEDDSKCSELTELIRTDNITLIFLDTRTYNADSIEIISKYSKIVVFDDTILPQRIAGIINYSPFIELNEYLLNYSNSDTKLFLGGNFAPVPSEYGNIKKKNIKEVQDIMLNVSGYDDFNVVCNLISMLVCKEWIQNCKIHVYINDDNYRYIDVLKRLKTDYEAIIEIYTGEYNKRSLIEQCDLAVSAGIMEVMELAAGGMPTILYAESSYDSEFVRQMIVKEYAVGVGDIWVSTDVKIRNIVSNIEMLMNNYEKRRQLSRRIKTINDGKGTDRIISALGDLL